MKLPLLLNRESRRSLLIGITPYQYLVAGLKRRDGNHVDLDTVAEFPLDDEAGLKRWLSQNFEHNAAWVPVVCGLSTPSAIVQRHSILPRRLGEENYLAELCNLAARPDGSGPWKLQLLSPLEGQQIAAQGGQRPALLVGVSHDTVHNVQQRLLDLRLLPYRLELSSLPLFAALYDRQAKANDPRATVVVQVAQEQTTAFILGKEGVHTPAPLHHGFTSVVQAARKEMHLNEAQEVADRLHFPDDEVLLRASKFLRAIGRDLKSVIDSYELTTGQPVGEIYFDHLPPSLAWMAEPLSQIVGRPRYEIDCAAWMPEVGLNIAPGMPPFGAHWFSTLSLLASIPASMPETQPREDEPFKGAWRLDCRISAELPSTDVIGRKFIVNAIAGALAGLSLVFAIWQGYSAYVVRGEIAVIRQRIADNMPAFSVYEKSAAELNSLGTKIDAAWDVLSSPFLFTDFLTELGQTKPPVLRIDSITQSPGIISVRGDIAEPSNRASQTLGNYVRELRANPKFTGPFATVSLTDLSRSPTNSSFTFEIQFKLKNAKP